MTARGWFTMSLTVAGLGLSACQQEQAPAAVADSDGTQAQGQVLEGTVNDRMIPYDALGQEIAPTAPAGGEPAPEIGAPAAPRTPARAASPNTARAAAGGAEEPDGEAPTPSPAEPE